MDEAIESSFGVGKMLVEKMNGEKIIDIRDQIKIIINYFKMTIALILMNIEKICYLSIIFLIIDATSYRWNYFRDDSFDNKVNNIKGI